MMEDAEGSAHEELTSIILDGQDVIGTAGDEVFITDAEKSQREAFKLGADQYRDSLTSSMREKSMITEDMYDTIMNALRCGKGGNKAGIDVKFYSWCKAHFRIIDSAGTAILYSTKSGVRIAVFENHFQV